MLARVWLLVRFYLIIKIDFIIDLLIDKIDRKQLYYKNREKFKCSTLRVWESRAGRNYASSATFGTSRDIIIDNSTLNIDDKYIILYKYNVVNFTLYSIFYDLRYSQYLF